MARFSRSASTRIDDFKDPETRAAVEILNEISVGNSTMTGKRVRVQGRVSKPLVDGKVVLAGDDQRTVVCSLPAMPKTPLDVGDAYLIDSSEID